MEFLNFLFFYLPQILAYTNSTSLSSNQSIASKIDWLMDERRKFYKAKAEKIAVDFETAYSDPTSKNCQKALAEQITFCYPDKNLTFSRDGYVTDAAKFQRRLTESSQKVGEIKIIDQYWDTFYFVVKYDIVNKRNMVLRAKADRESDILKVYFVEEKPISKMG